MKVLVTGSSSTLARALLPRLCADAGIAQVTGIDLQPAHFTHPGFRALVMDFRDPQLLELLPQHDALVHLAYVVLRGHVSASAMHAINVTGSLALLLQARAAGMRRIVHLSSAAVYGSGENLSETAPYAPLQAFLYGRHKAELERQLDAALPECLRLRPHVILGPHAQPVLRQLLALPFYLRTAGPQPQLQCVHESDVAEAILRGLAGDARGAINLAAPDTFNLRDVKRGSHRWCLPLPAFAARAALHAAHRISGWGGEPGWLDGLQQSLTLDCSRAAAELRWRPARSAAQALADTR